ncbi:glycosyltransferase [Peribacillus sp. NPDC097225]|uniref:glycosyltransferase n=1 Tax=Peribacillus sp. NPDC097225 TaxID=3364400 RepID=UPI0037FD3BF4
MKKLSVIVPVYNVEKYINRCITSLVNQTYTNLEIILVNDGSTDNSGLICETYAKKDKRIKVLNQKNSGQSSARNNGLSVATGDLLGFVDSDDWIAINMYETLIENLEQLNCDISACQRINVKNEKEAFNAKKTNNVSTFERDEIIDVFLTRDMLAVYDKVYRKDIFENIIFPVDKIHEDICLTYLLMTKAKRISISDMEGYCYYSADGSTTRSPLKIKDFNMIDEWNKILENFTCENLSLVRKVNVRLYVSYFNLINKYVMFGAENIETEKKIKSNIDGWRKTLKDNKEVIINSEYVNASTSKQIKVLCVSYNTFKVTKKIYIYLVAKYVVSLN